VTGPDPAGLLALAVSAARQAAGLLSAGHGRVTVVQTKSSPTDVVTEMDRAAEELIRSHILAERPADAILGEEGGQQGEPDPGGVRWIVDPLDGTVNYLYGLPDWSVSIAAETGGTVVAGAVCVPGRGSLYTAVRGSGAWLQAADGPARRLACTTGVPLARALIGTGFGYESARRRVQGRVVGALLPLVRDIRRSGVCSVDLCSLAAGQLDGYYERGVHYWDIAAGSLIAREAGAVVGGLAGRPAGQSMTVAAGQPLFGELEHVLASLDPERDD
jgi:fructose-1,6-bisphosphatase/inositol monophosphatase family enzyme